MADLAGAIEFVVYMHATLAELLAFARCPIELTVDGAEGTNNQMLTSMNVMGRDANDKANRAAHVFVPSETNLAASTVIESLLPLLYGAVLHGVRLWVADGARRRRGQLLRHLCVHRLLAELSNTRPIVGLHLCLLVRGVVQGMLRCLLCICRRHRIQYMCMIDLNVAVR